MFRRILVAVDCAESSSWQKALPVAVNLAQTMNAQLHVTTVVSDITAILQAQYSTLAYDKLIAEAEQRLASIVADKVPSDLRRKPVIGRGGIYAEILRIANEIDADLIVMASHRPGMKDFLLGANAARVVRHANCSVLVVREP